MPANQNIFVPNLTLLISVLALITISLFSSCDKEIIYIEDNQPVSSFNISKIKIENYVQRLFIDLVGREPLEEEMEAHVLNLQQDSLKRSARTAIIELLMNDETEREGEGSYRAAYTLNLYNLAKIRCLEGVSDGYIRSQIGIANFAATKDSLEGNWESYYRRLESIRKYEAVINSREELFDRKIGFHQVFGAVINNAIYDQINMNTFNFVRAAFDELLWRLPAEEEFEIAFEMIENEEPGILFEGVGSNKNDFVELLIHSQSMFEGLVIWAFQIYLNRSPTPTELATFLPQLIEEKNIDNIIMDIMLTDEYANFR